MTVLILGRAIAGLGGSGIFNSGLMILTEVCDILVVLFDCGPLYGFENGKLMATPCSFTYS